MDIQEIIWQAVAVTLIVTVSVHFLPWVLSPLLVLSVATVSYDTVFDLLKSLVSGIKGKEEKGWPRL